MNHFKGILTLNVDILNPLLITKIIKILESVDTKILNARINKNTEFLYSYNIEFSTLLPIHIDELNNMIKSLNGEHFCYKTRKDTFWECDYIEFKKGSVEYI